MTNHHGEPQQAFDMTNDTRNDPLIDPALSDHLKSIPGETTPTGLDAAILREAKRAIRADNRSGTTAAWFRPLAFVVTVGLSLAIILELSESGILAPASDPDRVASPAGSGPPAAMPNGSRGNRDQATLNELKRQEKTPTAARQAEDAVIATDTLRRRRRRRAQEPARRFPWSPKKRCNACRYSMRTERQHRHHGRQARRKTPRQEPPAWKHRRRRHVPTRRGPRPMPGGNVSNRCAAPGSKRRPTGKPNH